MLKNTIETWEDRLSSSSKGFLVGREMVASHDILRQSMAPKGKPFCKALRGVYRVDVQKPHDAKSLACDATFHGLNELNWLPWLANPTANNPSTWAKLSSLDDAPSSASNALGLPSANSMEKNEFTDSLNQESTLSSPELITIHHDPHDMGKFTTCEETGTNDLGSASPNELEDHSTLISTIVEDCLKIDEVVNLSSFGNTNDGTNHSSDDESSKSDKEHEVNFATRQSLETSSGKTNDDSDHNSDSGSSKSDNEHEVKFATKSSLESSSGNTKDDSNHNSDSGSSKSDKEHEVKFAIKSSLESSSGNTKGDSNHNSDSGSSKSDKEHEVKFATKLSLESSSGNTKDDSNHNSDSGSSKNDKEHEVKFATKSSLEFSSGNTKDDSNHTNNSESSESDEEHEVKFATRQTLEKENDIITNDLKQPPLINTTTEECSKTDDVVYESSIRNTNDDRDHDSGSESSKSDKELEAFNFTVRQPLETKFDLVTNDLKESPLINPKIEELPKTDEEDYECVVKRFNDDIDNVSESTESDKEQEVVNFSIGQSSEMETNLVTNALNESPLINKSVEEFSKIDEVDYVSTNRNTIDDMEHNSANESSESDKEQEVADFSIGQSLEKETNPVTNDLNESPLTRTIVEEFPKIDEVICVSPNRNIIDDMDHDSANESSESDKEQETINFSIGQPLEKETNLVTNDLKESPLTSSSVEEYPKTDEVAYEFVVKNNNDDTDNVSESTESDKELEVINFSIGQSSEKETDLVINDWSLLTNTTIEQGPTIDEATHESTIMITNDDMDHSSSISESSVGDKQQEAFDFPSKRDSNIVTNDMEQFSLQSNHGELDNQSLSDDECHNFSISYDDVQEKFASGFSITPTFHRSVSMESVESLDGSNVSEIEGENIVDRLKRQVEYDKKCINSLYKELEEERSASEVAASQAMAMITRLQEEKAAMHMEALHYLRMMEEQAEYDVEALEKANELLNEKERDVQDLEAEIEYYRSNYMVDTIAETEHEKSDCANEENITTENDIIEHHEYNANYSFKSIIVDSSKASYRSCTNQNSSFEFEDEKSYIQLCLRNLEDKMNKMFSNGLLARAPNSIDIEDQEVVNPEQKGEEDQSVDAEKSQRNNEENSSSIDRNNDRFGSDENCPDMKDQMSCANRREEVDFLALENKISNLTGRLEALQGDYDFLEHSLNSFHYGEDGLQFAQNIVHQLHELCKLGIRLDRQPGS